MRVLQRPILGLACLTFAIAALLLASRSAQAQGQTQAGPSVFLNVIDAPIDPGLPFAFPPEQSHTAYLYLDAGSSASATGTPCFDGDGQELCAYQLYVQGEGDLDLSSFVPEPGVIDNFLASNNAVSIVWSSPSAPQLGPARVGSLTFSTYSGEGSVRLENGGAVVGRLDFITLETEDLALNAAVPEPGFAAMLFAGLFGLVLGHRRREGRRARGPNGSRVALDLALLLALNLTVGLSPLPSAAADPTLPVTPRWRQLALGLDHTCGLLASGDIECVGSNSLQQVSGAPATGTFLRISAGTNTTCAIEKSRKIVCWGGGSAAISDGLLPVPVAVAAEFFVDVSVADGHACAVATDREVVCWGRNGNGQAAPPAGLLATEVAAGIRHSCARKPNGRAECWGGGGSGAETVPPAFEASRYEHVVVGEAHSCGVGEDDSVDCWGDPSLGRLNPPNGYESISARGDHSCGILLGGVECWGGDTSGEASPPVLSDAVAVYTSVDHSCARRADDSILCWGDPLAYGTTLPTTGSNDVAAGLDFSCGLDFAGQPECWGENSLGQLAAPNRDYVMLGTGLSHACGLVASGAVACWGDSANGKTTVPMNLEARRIAAGGNASCAIEEPSNPGGPASLNCWGDPAFGITSPPAGSFREVAVGLQHACAIASDSSVVCWGDSSGSRLAAPTQRFREIAAGNDHTCAISTNGGLVRCWGDDSEGQSVTQTAVFSDIATGNQFSCGLLDSGRIRCWGDGFLEKTTAPPGRYVQISAGQGHACATRLGGGFACWGFSDANFSPIADVDADGIEDGIDNCPFDANPNQADGDSDGAGDLCDVCPVFPDVDQLDVDGDGVGDRCDVPARVEIEPRSINPADATYNLYLDCGSSTITRMTPEIVIPFFDPGTLTPVTNFGDGCDATDCTGANPSAIGSVVDLASSSVEVQISAGIGRVGALELDLHGNPNLCTPGDRNFIGLMRVDGITSFEVLPTPAPSNTDTSPLLNEFGVPTPGPLFNQLPPNAVVHVRLDNLGDDQYALYLESELSLHRATVGLRIPPGGGALSVVSYGPTVAAPPDHEQPPPPPPGPTTDEIRNDTHYFQFEGTIPLGPPLLALNLGSAPPVPVHLMTFEVPSALGFPVILEVEGVDQSFPGEAAFLDINGASEDLEDIGFVFFASNDDTDVDGISDDTDNCAFRSNALQEDNGSFDSLEANLRGDACECGDASGEGTVTSGLDPATLELFLAGVPPMSSSTGALCSVTGGAECNVLDLVALDLIFQGVASGVQHVCTGAIGEPTQSP